MQPDHVELRSKRTIKQHQHPRKEGVDLWRKKHTAELLLPGALLVTIQTQLLAPFVLVNFGLAALFQ
jgi:hypothetical protein